MLPSFKEKNKERKTDFLNLAMKAGPPQWHEVI